MFGWILIRTFHYVYEMPLCATKHSLSFQSSSDSCTKKLISQLYTPESVQVASMLSQTLQHC